jgi:hypothetical protein
MTAPLRILVILLLLAPLKDVMTITSESKITIFALTN